MTIIGGAGTAMTVPAFLVHGMSQKGSHHRYTRISQSSRITKITDASSSPLLCSGSDDLGDGTTDGNRLSRATRPRLEMFITELNHTYIKGQASTEPRPRTISRSTTEGGEVDTRQFGFTYISTATVGTESPVTPLPT